MTKIHGDQRLKNPTLQQSFLAAGSFSHTEGIVSCNGALASGSVALQLTTHRNVGLDLCLQTHCCGWICFQSACCIFPIQPDKSNHRREPVIVFITRHINLGENPGCMELHTVRLPCGMNAEKWNQL